MHNNFPYWGIDGCKGGWFCVGLNDGNEHAFFVAPDIDAVHETLLKHKAKIALIDIPIGLVDDGEKRECEMRARKIVGKMFRSVFRTPCRAALESYQKGKSPKDKIARGMAKSVKIGGGKLPLQTWYIAGKIAEVDRFMQNNNGKKFKLREVIAELCFCALNRAPLRHGKRTAAGEKERMRILKKHLSAAARLKQKARARHLKKHVADDDIVDAMAVAATAKIGHPDHYQTLPQNPPKDSRGLSMEMVFVDGATK